MNLLISRILLCSLKWLAIIPSGKTDFVRWKQETVLKSSWIPNSVRGNVISIIECGVACQNNQNCDAFVYDPSGKSCSLGNEGPTLSAFTNTSPKLVEKVMTLFDNSKIMVVNGATGPGKSANTVEVIDLRSNQQQSCTIPDYPDPNMASFGGLVNDSIPMVCGGVIPPSSSCYFLIKGSWQQGPSTSKTRAIAVGKPPSPFFTNQVDFMVVSGQGNPSLEVLQGDKWVSSNISPLPTDTWASCMTYRSLDTLFIIAGVQNNVYGVKNTFFISPRSINWQQGPSLNQQRFGHSCGRIITDTFSNKYSMIVVGGFKDSTYATLTSVEILDESSNTWRNGPDLPLGIAASVIVTDPFGGAILIGGSTGSDGPALNTIYRLRDASPHTIAWELLDASLSVARYWPVAFSIPNSILKCGVIGKAMIATGMTATGYYTDEVEVVDLRSPTSKCVPLPRYPYMTVGTYGGFAYQDTPMVCGGKGISATICCALSTKWIVDSTILAPRIFAAGIASTPFLSNQMSFFVTGGQDQQSSEILFGKLWSNFQQAPVPSNISKSCIVPMESPTLFLVGGNQDGIPEGKSTYTINFDGSGWIAGPQLSQGRNSHGCGRVLQDFTSGILVPIVVGGFISGNVPISSVEMLDASGTTWKPGPSLPVPIAGASLISGDNGEVYLMGGIDDSGLALQTIYKLENGASSWVLHQKLQRGRYFATAFSVSDYTARCSKESTKMLVGGGLMPDGGISGFMEVLDTENPNMVCQPIPNYPLPIQNPIYGLLNDNKTILVCTAFSHAQCMKLTPTNWVTIPGPSSDFSLGSSVVLPSTFVSPITFFTSGSLTTNKGYTFDGTTWGSGGTVPGTTTEIVQQCAIYFDDTRILVVGGRRDNLQSGDTATYFVTFPGSLWSNGPSLPQGRYGTQCGRIASSYSGSLDSMIVAGGTPGNSQLPIREVDILDYGSNAWRLGTPLPVGIYGGASITDPLGGFIVAGGSTEFSFALTSKIYRLRNALPDTKWELLPISLDGPRGNLFATPIPDSLVTCKPASFKVLVGTGTPQGSYDGTNYFEVIDFSDPTLVCNQFPPLPIPQTACTAGALDGTLPLVCCLTSCYTFQGGQWNAAPSLTSNHYMSYHTAVPTTFNAPFKFFVAGGLSNDKTWQTFDGSTWSASAAIPVVTTSMASGCATYRDNSTIVLAGGTIDGVTASNKTFFVTYPGAVWSAGPSMAQGRYANRCARISSGSFGVGDAVIVVGGSDSVYGAAFMTTEVLDNGASAWRAGPPLPMGRSAGTLVSDPRGGVVYISGLDGSSAYPETFRLKNVETSWEVLPQVAQNPKYWAVAISIPDELASCYKASNPGFKVYIGTGATDVNGLGNPGGEVFDLQALSTNCSPLPAFPVTDHGQVGGLYAGKIPMICGGTNSLLCYQLQSNVWVQVASLTTKRIHAAHLVIPPTANLPFKFIVVSGQTTDSSEIYDGSSWIPNAVPTLKSGSRWGSCLTMIDDSTLILLGGILVSTSMPISETLMLKYPSPTDWTTGPSLLTNNYGMSCGKIAPGPQGGSFGVIVAGGCSAEPCGALSNVNILDFGSTTWRAGPQMPIGLKAPVMTTDPFGGVIVFGGQDSSLTPLNVILRLSNSNYYAKWRTLPRTLADKRYWALTFLIPDELTSCAE